TATRGSRLRGMLHAAGKPKGVPRLEPVIDALDDHVDLAFEDVAHLLVRMAVQRHVRVRIELDEVEHEGIAEDGPAADAGGEVVRRLAVEVREGAHGAGV